jgi:hypothetical protein
MSNRSMLLLWLLSVCMTGCGLRDYADRMEQERARVKLFDEENRLLGEMPEAPAPLKSDKEGEPDRPIWPFEVFLRLPAKVAGQVESVFAASPPVPVAKYKGKDGLTVFIAVGLVAEKNEKNIYAPNSWPPDDFRRSVRKAIELDYQKTTKSVARLFPKEQGVRDKRQPQTWRAETPPALDYEKFTGNDSDNKNAKEPSQFELYYYRSGSRQIAIGFQIPQRLAGDKSVTDGIDLCLKSLDVSDQAAARRSELAAFLARRKR